MDEPFARLDLSKRALKSALIFLVVLWLAIFLAAGSLGYWQGWVFWMHFAVWTLGGTLYFLERDPALVARRLRAGPTAEKEPAQKRIQLFASIAICAVFIVSGLDHRFGWSRVPDLTTMVGNILVALGYLFMFIVFRENSFASSTIEVAADQKVVSTGPYALVRHPMYAGAMVMFVGAPLALGSWWGLVPVLLLIASLVARLREEESYLARNLPGYDTYRRNVRFRLAPGVW
jgi:protein-S-isoprenylcysteine O-methyltransferase Ste14